MSLRGLGEEAEAREWAERAEAFDCLNRAVDLGYGRQHWIEHGVDLEPLHGDARRGQLLDRFSRQERPRSG